MFVLHCITKRKIKMPKEKCHLHLLRSLLGLEFPFSFSFFLSLFLYHYVPSYNPIKPSCFFFTISIYLSVWIRFDGMNSQLTVPFKIYMHAYISLQIGHVIDAEFELWTAKKSIHFWNPWLYVYSIHQWSIGILVFTLIQ